MFVDHGLITREDRDLNIGMFHINQALTTIKQYFEAEGIKVNVIFTGQIEFEFDWGTEQ